MTSRNIKLFIGISVLLAYIGIGVFGLFKFNHMTPTPMTNCPYAQNGSSLCENSLDHINDWHQFSNVVLSSLFVFLSIVLGIILYFFVGQNFFNQKLHFFYQWKYYLDNKNLDNYLDRIIKWLSLFENSPSFYIGA